MQGFCWSQPKYRVRLTILTCPVHKGSANDGLFPYGSWSLSRGGELLLVMMAWVTEADVLLRATAVSGLFLDFLDCVKCPGAACFVTEFLHLSSKACSSSEEHCLPRIPKSCGRYHSPFCREALCCSSSLLAVPSKCNFPFFRQSFPVAQHYEVAPLLCPASRRLPDMPILLSPLFSGPRVSK